MLLALAFLIGATVFFGYAAWLSHQDRDYKLSVPLGCLMTLTGLAAIWIGVAL